MGGVVGDVAPRLVPGGRDSDGARHVLAAARLQLGEEGADAAARIEHVVAGEQAVVGAERVDQIAEREHLYLGIGAVDAGLGGGKIGRASCRVSVCQFV